MDDMKDIVCNGKHINLMTKYIMGAIDERIKVNSEEYDELERAIRENIEGCLSIIEEEINQPPL